MRAKYIWKEDTVMPRLSVISGAYNIGKCYSFEKSMDSILSQSFSDFEFIICDDGSTDDTWSLLSAYAATDPRIKLLRNEKNLGLAASLNRCIEVSGSEFIARHDLDDYNSVDRFEKQIAFFESNPEISVLGCCTSLFDKDGVWAAEQFPERVEKRDFLFTSPYKHGSVMFRRDVLIKAGGYRVARETYRTEDYDLFMTLQTFTLGANLQEYLYFFCEDKDARRRRKYRYRIDEAKVRYRGFKKLGLLPRGIPYVIKPLVVGLIPSFVLEKLKNRSKRRKIIKQTTGERNALQ